MRKFILTTVAILVAMPAFAQDLAVDTVLGHSMEEVKAKLTEMGYDVRKGEMEDGRIEVYVVKDSRMGEVYVDATTGKIARLSLK